MQEYLNLIRSQNLLNLTHPKLFSGPTSFFTYSDLNSVLNEVNNALYTYSGVITLPGLVFGLTTPTLAWEFVLNPKQNTLPNLKFLYLPISLQGSITKLPSYKSVNSELRTSTTIYPSFLNLIQSNLDRFNSYYTLDTYPNTYTHSFLPFFQFTGRTTTINDKLVYEYQDVGGYYGQLGELYISQLRPHNLPYPLGTPYSYELEETECYASLVGFYPPICDPYYLGRFTGKTTTSRYSPITFYQYYNPYSYSYFLSEVPPHSYAEALTKFAGIFGPEGIYIPTTFSEEAVLISQTSTLNSITFT